MNYKWILAPILGAVIGFITNDIAIKMLFHPYKEIYIGKFHVPFTPGLIPSQKDRIAKSIGAMVSKHLLDPETMQNTLLSDETLTRIGKGIRSRLDRLQTDERTVEQVLETVDQSRVNISAYRENIKEGSVKALLMKITDGQIGDSVSKTILEETNKRFGSGTSGMVNDLGVPNFVGKLVNDLVSKNAPKIIEDQVGKIEEDLMSMKLSDLYERNTEYIPRIVDEITNLYCYIVEENLEKTLSVVDIEGIVVKKIQSFDAEKLENMVFGIMKRELSAIVYLGAALGFLMGFINVLF